MDQNPHQKMISARCHEDVISAIDNLIPSTYMNRAEFLIDAIREKLERDNITY